MFKSIWFKCISCLLAILLVSGASITVLSNVLYVTPEVRTQRGIIKVYGELVDYETIFDIDNAQFNDDTLTEEEKAVIITDDGRINKIFIVGDKQSEKYELLFQSIGYKGFKNGTVTVWSRVVCENGTYTLEQVILSSNTSQSLINNLDGKFFSKYHVNDLLQNFKDKLFTTDKTADGQINFNPSSGATYSATASNNAVNCVVKYIEFIGGNA